MKKFLKILMLAIISVACIVTAVACAPTDGDSSEKGLLYKKIAGVYTIYDYVDDGRTETTLDIGKELADGIKVTAIDEGAFSGMKALTKITLPFVGASANADATYGDTESSVDKATDNARTFGYLFGSEEYDGGSLVVTTYDASGSTENRYMPTTLRSVTIDAVDGYKIPMHAFNGCVNLVNVELKGNIAEIGEYAFNGCKNLVNVAVPSSATKIHKNAFANCTALDKDVLKNATALVEIGESAFENAKLDTVIFNANAIIGKKAFSASSVKSITLKGEVVVGISAFANCVKLENVTIDNVTNGVIRQFAFQGATKLRAFDTSNFTVVEDLAFDVE